MGVSSSFVLGTEAQLPQIAEAPTPWDTFGGMYSRIDMLSLCNLIQIISDSSSPLAYLGGFKKIYSPNEDEGPWITNVHPDLISSVIQVVDNNQQDNIAQQWSDTAELSGWDSAELAEVLQNMAKVFRKAQAEDKNVYLVNML